MARLLPAMKDDTNKVKLLRKICESYFSDTVTSQKIIQYAGQGLQLAQKLGWIQGQVDALTTLGIAQAYNGNYQKYPVYIKEAYALAKKNRLTDKQYSLQISLAYIYSGNKDYEAALSNAKEALDYYLKFRPGDIDTSNWFVCNIWWQPAFHVGGIYSALKKDTAALNLYHLILNRFTKEKDSLGMRTAFNLLMRYSNDYMERYDESRKYCFEELKYFRKGDTSVAHASVLTYIANSYRLQKDYVKALEYYRIAIALKPDTHIEIRNSANSGMRLIYFQLGDYNNALNLDLEQLRDASRPDNPDSDYEKLGLYDYIADDYNHLQQYDQSLYYLNKELKLSDNMGWSGKYTRILLSLANLYYLTHRYDEALLKIQESTHVRYFKTDEWSQSVNSLYKGKIIRDAPDSVLRKYNIPSAGKYRKSVSMLQKALTYFSTHYQTYWLPDCYKELSIAYDSLKDYRNFYSTYKTYISLRDSSINRANQNAFISKLAGIQFEKKEDSLRYQQRLTSEKLRQQTQLTAQQRKYYISGIIALLAIFFFIARNYYNQRRSNRLLTVANAEITQANQQISVEKQRSDSLLLNILPPDVAEELKEKGTAGARLFEEVTVLFTDFVNFTTISVLLTPQELVDELHTCFKAFDDIIGKHGIEKIKTIGDAYLAVAGLPNADARHASNTIQAALEIRQFIRDRKEHMGSRSFDIRIGIHSGSVVAGIVGVKKFAYDIWGDTVNTAARMEQHSSPGQINLSEKTYELVKDQFAFTYRGEIEAKNKGALKMYFVEKRPVSAGVNQLS